MDYNTKTVGDTFEGHLSGRVTFSDQKPFRVLLEEMKNSTASKWIMDLTKLDFIDSAGLGLLLRVKASAEQKDATFTLRVADTGNVRTLMDVAKFNQLISFE